MAGSDGISRVSAVFRGKLLLTNKIRIIWKKDLFQEN